MTSICFLTSEQQTVSSCERERSPLTFGEDLSDLLWSEERSHAGDPSRRKQRCTERDSVSHQTEPTRCLTASDSNLSSISSLVSLAVHVRLFLLLNKLQSSLLAKVKIRGPSWTQRVSKLHLSSSVCSGLDRPNFLLPSFFPFFFCVSLYIALCPLCRRYVRSLAETEVEVLLVWRDH